MATPTTNGRRTQELVLRDIEAEREQLAAAVDHLRDGIGEATDVSRLLRGRLPIASAAAFGTGFFLAGGIGATMRLLARRSRDR